MPDLPLPTSPPEQVVRFRIRTLLAVTAAVAVLSAIAAPYYRRQPPESQQLLLNYWACLGLTAVFSVYFAWRGSWRLCPKAGAVLCVLWSNGRSGLNFLSRPKATAAFFLFWMGFIGFYSFTTASRPDTTRMWYVAITGLAHGMMMGGFLMVFVPHPFYLCENGVSIGKWVLPWHYIRSAEWVATNRSVLRLHRFDGDLFVRVPDYLRDGVQKLVAERTRFVGETVHLAPGQ
jgi:hypothetical protein